MSDFLVSFRNNHTNKLFNVQITNVEDDQHAITMANNNLLDADQYHYESVCQLCEQSPEDTF